MHQPNTVAREQDCGKCGAHPLELGFHLDLCGNSRVAGAHRRIELREQVATRFVVVEMSQRGDHQLRCHFAGGVATHAIGQGQKSCAGIDRVFVVGAYQAAIAAGGISQDQGHGRSSIAVLPIRTGVPIGTRTAVVTFALSR